MNEGVSPLKVTEMGPEGEKKKKIKKRQRQFSDSQVGPVGPRAKSFAPLSRSKAITL